MTTNSLPEKSTVSNLQAKEIAKSIITQLGGSRFIAMTGANNFIALAENGTQLGGLTFKIPTTLCKNKINRITIRLMQNDTYGMEFFSLCGTTLKSVSSYDHVYCDMLTSLFTDETGLDVAL